MGSCSSVVGRQETDYKHRHESTKKVFLDLKKLAAPDATANDTHAAAQVICIVWAHSEGEDESDRETALICL